ncbi:MAG: hypothetical protein R3E02_06865 [Blastomonas sp.]
MNARLALLPAAIAMLTLPGCVARTAANIVTAPVRLVGTGVDKMTTSQSEADEKRGREMRKHEERVGKLNRKLDRAEDHCRQGDDGACNDMRRLQRELTEEMKNAPY